MERYIKVVPVGGAKVLHPQTMAEIPAEGKRVKHEAYWDRMQKQGVIKIHEYKASEEKGK